MDLEPPLTKKQSSEFDTAQFNNEIDQPLTDSEDPYSFTSTSTSLIGLVIVFAMLGIPLFAVLYERPLPKKSVNQTFLDQNGSKSSASFTFSWFS